MNEEKKTDRLGEKLLTIQKRNNLNEVYRWDEPGPGGAWHKYLVRDAETKGGVVLIFQKGPRNEKGSQPGMLDCDLLEIVRDRFRCFQAGEFACMENACALTHIEEALMWMNRRVEDRSERQVLGTYEK